MRLILAASLALAPVAAGAATRSYTVTGFEKIRVAAPYAVTVAIGPAGTVKAEGAPADIDRVRIVVLGRTLVVSADRDTAAWQRDSGPVRIVVGTPSLAAAQVGGAGTLAIDRVKGERLDLAIAGAGELRVGTLAVEQLGISVLGAGDVTVAGKATRTRVAVQGAGNVDGKALTAQEADISVTGAGNVALAATRSAKVISSGVGQVTVTGGAKCTVTRTGLGEVACGR